MERSLLRAVFAFPAAILGPRCDKCRFECANASRRFRPLRPVFEAGLDESNELNISSSDVHNLHTFYISRIYSRRRYVSTANMWVHLEHGERPSKPRPSKHVRRLPGPPAPPHDPGARGEPWPHAAGRRDAAVPRGDPALRNVEGKSV